MKTFITILLVLYAWCVFGQPFATQSEWNAYFNNQTLSLDPIEGVWRCTSTMKMYNDYNELIYIKKDTIKEIHAIYKVNSTFSSYAIDGVTQPGISFLNTAIRGVYSVDVFCKNSYSIVKSSAIAGGGDSLEFSFKKPADYMKYGSGEHRIGGVHIAFEYQCIKVYPKGQPTKDGGF